MKKMTLSTFTALVLMLTTTLLAADIPVTNSDFESQTMANGTWTGSITGWTLSKNTGGLFNPDSSHFTSEAGAGFYGNTAYSNGATISQILSTNLVADTTYTLTVDVGNRLDTNFPGYSIQIKANGTTLATKSGIANSIPSDTFEEVTLVYTTTSSDPVGYPIEIHLASCGEQTNFDNVSLVTGDNPCELLTGDVIKTDTILYVSNGPGDFDTIQDALACLSDKIILGDAIMTIQVADGTYTGYDTINLTHDQGDQIHIIGNTTTPSNVTLEFTGAGVYVTNGMVLGYMNGFRLKGALSGDNGVHADKNAVINLGPNMEVREFYQGVNATFGATIDADYVNSSYNSGHGFIAHQGGSLSAEYGTATYNGASGATAWLSGSVRFDFGVSTNNSNNGIHAFWDGTVVAGGVTVQNNGQYGFNAQHMALIYATNATNSGNGLGNFSELNSARVIQ